MQKLRCSECGKYYDFEKDDFCPKCGTFNQPKRNPCADGGGAVIRSEGLNEKNHAGSFVHQEFHTENHARKASGLSRSADHTAAKGASSHIRPGMRSALQGNGGRAQGGNPLRIILWVIFALAVFNILTGVLMLLF